MVRHIIKELFIIKGSIIYHLQKRTRLGLGTLTNACNPNLGGL
jgi:hypothetical protein